VVGLLATTCSEMKPITMKNHRIVITGLGVVTPLGSTLESFWNGLVRGQNGVGPITLFDASAFPVKVAAEVKGFDPTQYMGMKRADRSGRCAQFAVSAARMAMTCAGLDMAKERAERVGVIIGTSGMPELLAEQADIIAKKGPMRVDPLIVSKFRASMVPAHVGLDVGAKGINTSINSACASGNDALGIALNFLRSGCADVIITGGAGTNVTPLAIAATNRIGALSRVSDPETACRPFDANRSGFVYGEGSGILVLETLEHAERRGAVILAELAGAGWSFDSHSETTPQAEQEAVAMHLAMQDADIAPEQIDYINAHGTGTRLNDITETQAIKQAFNDRAYQIPLSSNKSMIGHLGCASGAVEAIASVMTIRDNILPPTIHYETRDPECDLDYVPNKAREKRVNVILSNSFGLGGQNCCLVIRRFI
jgi:3-oxoacyl-[acyl-carrier-protein] synthase II